MQPARSVLQKQWMLALAIGLAALALRLAVPAGFMPASERGLYALAPCPAAAGAMAGMGHDGGGETRAGASCAFAELSLPAIGGAGRVPVAAPQGFAAIAALFAGAALPARAALRLLPPLRGPPLPR